MTEEEEDSTLIVASRSFHSLEDGSHDVKRTCYCSTIIPKGNLEELLSIFFVSVVSIVECECSIVVTDT